MSSQSYEFTTPAGIVVTRRTRPITYLTALDGFAERLDRERGALFSSGVDYPGRYTRWEFGFAAPPLEIVGHDRRLSVRALSPRGEKILAILAPVLRGTPGAIVGTADARELTLEIPPGDGVFAEEERSLQPSLISPLRQLISEFRGIEDAFLGLYGAFAYDLLFQFDPIALRLARPVGQRELHLYLPDSLYVVDRRKEQAFRLDYELARDGLSTVGVRSQSFGGPLPTAKRHADAPSAAPVITSDHTPEEYATLVDRARERMRVGDIFEVVLSRTFTTAYAGAPSALFKRLKQVNPSPFEFLIQLGADQLVGTSPEMFVRVEGDRVESCPISGTARRGRNAMEDAERLKALIDSEKDEVELTMCTDVDRNDKSRICRPGTIKLLGRRLIETYAGLFHTVDHVEGRLRPEFTGLDAFLSHMWAVTLTGAPKKMATRIVEGLEKSPRGWYGGAVGALMLSGDVSTGITIRTVHLENGRADYRVGATLVWDSVGTAEDEETRIKATAMFRAFAPAGGATTGMTPARPGAGKRIVIVDNEDSFVHTLADYFRQAGAEVATYRHGLPVERIVALAPDLVVHSPGPGRPADFGVPALIRALATEGVPQFGVCLGLQGMVEAFGGALEVLSQPRHGKHWDVCHDGDPLFDGVPTPMRVGAYHSLTARRDGFPAEALEIVARTETGLVMAVRHRQLPLAAVQFHPESILSMGVIAAGETGRTVIDNVVRTMAHRVAVARTAPNEVVE
ncbi:MAG TPA: anthranilate synthase component I [Alphaproteobacteria bacterium]|nr:anthranilate synthase component I [Alphaproteobacteria bacterium]